ncbi:MAG: hypothetical protein K2X94_02630 [Amoebophilaceae bacterium]|nr:hypothetical protein [Amoebophilaceae bacterium]
MKDESSILGWINYLAGAPLRNYATYIPPVDITKNGCKAGKLVTFPQKIEAIACKVGDWKDPKVLLTSKDFLVMYKHSDYYWEESMAYLANPSYTEEHKKLAIYAMEFLDIDKYLTYLDRAYQLYTTGKLSASLLSTVICFDFLHYHRIVLSQNHRFYGQKIAVCLEKIMANPALPNEIALKIKKIVSGELLALWKKEPDQDGYNVYNHPFKFSKIIGEAEQELLAYYNGGFCDAFPNGDNLSDFIIILDHPSYYTSIGIEGTEDSANLFISMPRFSLEQRRLAIFAMHRLDVSAYAEFIRNVCSSYRGGNISPQMIEDLLCCFYDTGSSRLKYSFSIIDYKHPDLQRALDRLIEIPTLPCGLKTLARKVKNGTLATKEEMAYMEGYRQFRKTHFTLYETIPPRGG